MLFFRAVALAIVCVTTLSACSKDPEIAKREHLANGDRYLAEGKRAEAIIEYRQAISYDDRFGEARLKLGDAYLQSNDLRRALREYTRAADLLDQDEAHLKAAQMLLLGRNFEDAKTRADKVLARSPRNVEALLLRGSALAGLREVDAGLKEIEAAIAEDPTRAGAYLTLGSIQQVQGDMAAAEKSFLDGVKAQPDSVVAHVSLANFYWRAKRIEEASQALAAARKLDPQNTFTNRFAAVFYMSTGREAEAEAPLKILADSSTGVEGRLGLSDYYLRLGRRDEAVALLNEVVKEDAGFVPGRLRQASLARFEGDKATADKWLDEILSKNPKSVPALVAKTQFRLADGQTAEALETARLAVAAEPRDPNSHFMLGQALTAQRDAMAAEAAYAEALRIRPDHLGATGALARTKLALGKPEEAAQLAEAALQRAPGDAEALLTLVRAQIRLERIDAADQNLQRLAANFPEAPAVDVELGRVQAARNEFAKARQSFERALSRNPSFLPALSMMATLDIRDKRPADARARIDRALAANQRDGDMQLLAGRIYRTAGDDDAAEAAFRRAIELTPNNLRAFGALAGLYVSQGRLPESIREVERIIERRPADANARTILGMLLEAQSRGDEARQQYTKVLEINPRAAVAANNLAWMYADRGESLDVALQLARTAKAELPDVHEVSDTLGWVYYKNNLPAMAVEPFREAIAKDPDNAAYHLHLGLAYAKTGEPAKAREAVERAIQLDPKVTGLDEARAALEAVGQRLSR